MGPGGGRRGGGSVARSGLSNPLIQRRQRRCHLSAEAPCRSLVPTDALCPRGWGFAGTAGRGARVGEAQVPGERTPWLGACVLPTGLQGATPAHFAKGEEAESPRDWTLGRGDGQLGAWGSHRPGLRCAYAYTYVTTPALQVPSCWGGELTPPPPLTLAESRRLSVPQFPYLHHGRRTASLFPQVSR